MNFKTFCEQYEESEKENVLTQQEVDILKNNGFSVARNLKSSMINLGDDFIIDAFSDKTHSQLVLKKIHEKTEEELLSVKNKYLTDKIIKNFIQLAKEKQKNYK
jgi:hypothetical protein